VRGGVTGGKGEGSVGSGRGGAHDAGCRGGALSSGRGWEVDGITELFVGDWDCLLMGVNEGGVMRCWMGALVVFLRFVVIAVVLIIFWRAYVPFIMGLLLFTLPLFTCIIDFIPFPSLYTCLFL